MHTSVIAHSTTWSGDLESSGSLHVHGRVEGSLTARDTIFIAEEADVDAIIRAANVTIAGSQHDILFHHLLHRFMMAPNRGILHRDFAQETIQHGPLPA